MFWIGLIIGIAVGWFAKIGYDRLKNSFRIEG